MKKFSLLLNAILLGVIAFGGYKFIIEGSVGPSDDSRTVVILQKNERDFVLSEMRGFLETVEAVLTAVAANDMPAVAAIASASGMDSVGGAPTALVGKLPLEFKTLGMATHALFDDLATATESGDPQIVTAQLSMLVKNCTICHASYRIDIKD